MNKQELINKYKELENGSFDIGALVVCQLILKDLEQLDEPQKVVVPQFVADWYEEHKDNLEFNIFDYVYRFDQNAGFDFKDWFDDFNTKPIQTLVNMHQFGYEVEEKRYLVTIKGIVSNFMVLKHNINEDTWYMSNKINYTDLKAYHTKKELEEAGFGWVFDCPGIEIEEVEE